MKFPSIFLHNSKFPSILDFLFLPSNKPYRLFSFTQWPRFLINLFKHVTFVLDASKTIFIGAKIGQLISILLYIGLVLDASKTILISAISNTFSTYSNTSAVERIQNHFSTYLDHLDETRNYYGAFINVLQLHWIYPIWTDLIILLK